MTIAAETSFGLLHFHATLPSLRALRTLLPMTQDLSAELGAAAARRRRKNAETGAA